MFFTQTFKTHLPLALEPVTLSSLRRNFQNWIRREIVDDDPYDVETLFPMVKNFDPWDESVLYLYFKSPEIADYN